MRIHKSAEDYLEMILRLTEEKGYARSVDIAVGLSVWTVAEIVDLQNVLPREIAKSLTAAVDGMQARTIDTVSDAGKKAHAAYAAAAQDLARAACTETTTLASR